VTQDAEGHKIGVRPGRAARAERAGAGPSATGRGQLRSGRRGVDRGSERTARSRPAPWPATASWPAAATRAATGNSQAQPRRNRLRAATGLRLPATVVFDHPTPNAPAGYLLAKEALPEGSEHPGHAQLDQLEVALAGLEPGDPQRVGLMNRLQALLWKHTAPQAADGSDDLTGATADEMFTLIDRMGS
jgi:hypothetical protein